MRPIIHLFNNPDELAQAAARRFVTVVNRSAAERGSCSVALSGGETPRAVYRRLAGDEHSAEVQWNQIQIFFGDERLVPPDDPRSNFGMAMRELFSRVPLPAENIRRVRGELPAAHALADYRTRFTEFFRNETPRFDLILLGLGPDGHTASLFPGTNALDETHEAVAGVPASPAREARLTLTLPVINNAREVMFLVSGPNKAAVVRDVLTAEGPTHTLPATMVRPGRGELRWMLDEAAASQLPRGDGLIHIEEGDVND